MSWTDAEKQFVLDNYKNLTRKQMAKKLRRSPAGVANQMRLLGLTETLNASICWNCTRANAHDCMWVRSLRPIWQEAVTKEVRDRDMELYEVQIVRECQWYKEGEYE